MRGIPIMTNTEFAFMLLKRGLRQRCPVCGRGKIFKGWFKTYERCPACNFAFEREPGYYTGAMAVNLGATLPFLLPLLFYRPTKSLWMSLDHFFHPANREGV